MKTKQVTTIDVLTAKKPKSVDTLTYLANELERVMEAQEEFKAALEPFKKREEEIREAAIKELKARGHKSTKTDSGLTFVLVDGRITYGIKKVPGMKEAAVKYFMENNPNVLTIGAADLAKVVKPMLTLPEFVEKKEGAPFLQVRGAEEAE